MVSGRAAAKAARRGELLEIAWRVIDAEGERVALDRVAAAAGITRPILYRHFGDAQGLWLAVGDRFAATLLDAFTDLEGHDGRSLLEAVVDAFTRTIEAHPGVYRYLTRRPIDGQHPDGAPVRTFVASLADHVGGHLAGRGAPPVLAGIWGHTLVGAIHAAGDHWLDHRSTSRAELVEATTHLLWDGLARLSPKIARSATSP